MKKKCEKCGCEMENCKCDASCGTSKHKSCCCKGVTRIIAALIIAAGLVYVGYVMKGGCMMHGDMMKVEKK